jgi:hypothetical protein
MIAQFDVSTRCSHGSVSRFQGTSQETGRGPEATAQKVLIS